MASLGIGVVIATWYPLSHVILCICNCVRPLSHGFQPCQLSQRESQGAAAPPSHLPHISEPGDPQRCGSTARVADSNCQRVHTRPLSHGFQPCQLPQRGSQGAGFARPALRNFCSVIFGVHTHRNHPIRKNPRLIRFSRGDFCVIRLLPEPGSSSDPAGSGSGGRGRGL